MSTSTVLNLQRCRICLQKSEVTKNIFNIYYEDLDYSKLIFECSGIEISEDTLNAAVLICTRCEKSLLDTYLFRRLIIASNFILNDAEIVEQEIKVEEDLLSEIDFEESNEEPNDIQSDDTFAPNEAEVVEETITSEIDFDEPNDTSDESDDTFEPEAIKSKKDGSKKKCYKHKNLHRNCNKCKIQFPDKKLYVSHVRKEHSSKVVCPICGKSLCSFSLTAHLKTHTTEKKFICAICDKCLKSQSTLNTHMRTHTKEMRYKCEHCDEKFIHSSSRRKHTDQFHLGFKRYGCHMCTAKYFDHSALRSHISHHHTGEKKHKCFICGNFFMNVTILKYHKRTHLPEKQFSCDTCGKSFANNSGLTRHLKIHTTAKDYPCTECKRTFGQNSCLKKHMKSHIVHVLPIAEKERVKESDEIAIEGGEQS